MAVQWVTDIAEIFRATGERVQAIRTANNLLELSGTGDPGNIAGLCIGQEWLAQEMDAPRIVVVPIGTAYEGAKPMQNKGVPGYDIGKIPDRKAFYFRWMTFEAWFWGEPDPQYLDLPTDKVGNPVYDFNTTIELERQFCVGLYESISAPMAYPMSGEWRQTQNVNRRGRSLVVTFKIGTPVFGEPYTILAYQPAVSGVAIEVTISMGDSTTGPILIPGET